MRILLTLLCLAVTPLTQAAPANVEDLAAVFELSGVRLLCDQTLPLMERGLDARQKAQVDKLFGADKLCDDLANKLSTQIDSEQLEQARQLLGSPLAKLFTQAERAVAVDGAEQLADYRKKLAERAPRSSRLDLVKRLDSAARTTQMATLLRYESGKTQALIALKGRGESLDEQGLSAKTAEHRQVLHDSSQQAVESYMLFAYRRIPSDQLEQYAALYEQPAVKQLLDSAMQALPELFAQRRAQLP
ncbi:hypothetical protein [Pseudomonas sp. S9]|uniref:hypothetical protein n=1 Tax=Pseudomonas sp. S9 TaxID=686578 RepID=UPI0002556B11|nr:hypothetical protein [Pseudomonas sp. S9]